MRFPSPRDPYFSPSRPAPAPRPCRPDPRPRPRRPRRLLTIDGCVRRQKGVSVQDPSVSPFARPAPGVYPFVPSVSLDTLWFQVAGTLCNLKCTHCFISCSPTNHSHEMLTLEEVMERLREAEPLG